MKQSRLDLMEKAPVLRAVTRLAVPTVMASVVQLIYNLTDAYFIGQMGDPNQLAAISLLFPLIILFQAFGNTYAVGAASYISRLLGQKKMEHARHTCSTAFYTATGTGFLMMLLFLFFMDSILKLIGTSPDTEMFTREYFRIISIFSIPLILQVALAGLIRSEGATREAMTGMLIGTGINIILDPVMIFGMNLGISGAAWATAIGNICGVTYFLLHFRRGHTVLSIKASDFRLCRDIYTETFKIGLPASLSQLVMSISFITANNIAATYGDHVVAGFGVAQRVFSVAILLMIGYNLGYQPFAGYNYGAKNYERLIHGFRNTIISGTAVCLGFAFVFHVYAESLISIFTADPSVIQTGVEVLHAFNWCMPFFGIQITFMVTFQATGMALKALVVSLSRQCLIFFPLLFLLNHKYGFSGFIYAQPIADIATTVLALILSVAFFNEMNAKHRESEKAPEFL